MANPGASPFRVDAVCFDLLTALLDSWTLWETVAAEAGYAGRGRPWREDALRRMTAAGDYWPYEEPVREGAASAGLPPELTGRLLARWGELRPWPEVPATLARLRARHDLPLATVTNCRRCWPAGGSPRSALLSASSSAPSARALTRPTPGPTASP